MCSYGGKQLRILTTQAHRAIAAHRVPANCPTSGAHRKGFAYMLAQILDEKVLNHQRAPLMKYGLDRIWYRNIKIISIAPIGQHNNHRSLLSIERDIGLI